MTHVDAQRLQPLGLADARQFEQLRTVDRAAAHDDLARSPRLAPAATDGIAHADAALALEQKALAQSAGLDAQIRPLADRLQVAGRRAHAPARGNRRLAHGDAVLTGAVVVGIVRDAHFGRGLDHRGAERIGRLRVRDLERSVVAAEAIVAAVIALHALEERQDALVTPALIAHLRPGVEVLCLAAHEREAVDRARAAQHAATRHRNAPAVGIGLGFGAVEPVRRGIGDQLGEAHGHARPRMARGSGFQQKHLVARIGREPVRDDGASGAGTDDDIIVVHGSGVTVRRAPTILIDDVL